MLWPQRARGVSEHVFMTYADAASDCSVELGRATKAGGRAPSPPAAARWHARFIPRGTTALNEPLTDE